MSKNPSPLTTVMAVALVAIIIGAVMFGGERPQTALIGDIFQSVLRLRETGYMAMTATTAPLLPDTVFIEPETITETVYIEGVWIPDTVYTPADTVVVTASAVELVGGSYWGRITIDGKPIQVDISEWYEAPTARPTWRTSIGATATTEDVHARLRVSRHPIGPIRAEIEAGYPVRGGDGLELEAGVFIEF